MRTLTKSDPLIDPLVDYAKRFMNAHGAKPEEAARRALQDFNERHQSSFTAETGFGKQLHLRVLAKLQNTSVAAVRRRHPQIKFCGLQKTARLPYRDD